MNFKLVLTVTMILSSLSVVAQEYPTEGGTLGYRRCGKESNLYSGSVHTMYPNWVASAGEGITFEQVYDYYSIHANDRQSVAWNALMGPHLKRVWTGKYKSNDESRAEFYSDCLGSDFKRIIDTQI